MVHIDDLMMYLHRLWISIIIKINKFKLFQRHTRSKDLYSSQDSKSLWDIMLTEVSILEIFIIIYYRTLYSKSTYFFSLSNSSLGHDNYETLWILTIDIMFNGKEKIR